jgi:hypothetical protein
MIVVLGGLADVERDLICARRGEGGSRTKARGQHMGRWEYLLTVPTRRQSGNLKPSLAASSCRLGCTEGSQQVAHSDSQETPTGCVSAGSA